MSCPTNSWRPILASPSFGEKWSVSQKSLMQNTAWWYIQNLPSSFFLCCGAQECISLSRPSPLGPVHQPKPVPIHPGIVHYTVQSCAHRKQRSVEASCTLNVWRLSQQLRKVWNIHPQLPCSPHKWQTIFQPFWDMCVFGFFPVNLVIDKMFHISVELSPLLALFVLRFTDI